MILLAQLIRANVHKCPSLCLGWIKAILSIIGVPLTIWRYTYLLPYTAQSSPITRISITRRAGEKKWHNFFFPSGEIFFHSEILAILDLQKILQVTSAASSILHCKSSHSWHPSTLLFQLYCRWGLLCCSYSSYVVIFFFTIKCSN